MHGGFFFYLFSIIAVITTLLDWYVYSGLKTFTKDWRSKQIARTVLWGYLVLSVGVTVAFVIGSFTFNMMPFHEYLFSLFITFFVTKVFFVIALSLGDLGRFIYGLVNGIASHGKKRKAPFFPSRRKFISELAILTAAFPFTSFIYGIIWGKYDYKLHRETIFFDNLPDAFDGFTITQISDIHSGSFDSTAAVQRGIDLAKAQKSDLFVFTGDLVNNIAPEIEQYIPHFSQLKAPYGQFSILGNHDYGDYVHWKSDAEKKANLEKLQQHHKDLGYRLLMNENVVLEKSGQKIALIGVQNWGKGFIQLGDLDKALEGVDKDAFKILLSHDPTHWQEKVKHNPVQIDLTLSGHTHGAQFGVETAGFRWSPVQYKYQVWAGLGVENKRYLYVNRGFGFLAFSGRVGVWPEVTVITLKKKVA